MRVNNAFAAYKSEKINRAYTVNEFFNIKT